MITGTFLQVQTDQGSQTRALLELIWSTQKQSSEPLRLAFGTSAFTAIFAAAFLNDRAISYYQGFWSIVFVVALAGSMLAVLDAQRAHRLSGLVQVSGELSDEKWATILHPWLVDCEKNANRAFWGSAVSICAAANIILFSDVFLLGSCASTFATNTAFGAVVCSGPFDGEAK